VIAQLSVTDMRLPIQYAFSYPERWAGSLAPLDVAGLGALEFGPPDRARFPCLRLAYEALEHGGAWPVVLNAANEVAVAAFLGGKLPYSALAGVIAAALDALPVRPVHTLDDVVEADRATRRWLHEHHTTAATGDGR